MELPIKPKTNHDIILRQKVMLEKQIQNLTNDSEMENGVRKRKFAKFLKSTIDLNNQETESLNIEKMELNVYFIFEIKF